MFIVTDLVSLKICNWNMLLLNSLPPGKFFMPFCRLLIIVKINFFQNSFRNTIRVSNSLDPDQVRHFVGPDLGQNCLQKLSSDKTSSASDFFKIGGPK